MTMMVNYDVSGQDGDVHRHMYLQDLATSVAEDAQPAK